MKDPRVMTGECEIFQNLEIQDGGQVIHHLEIVVSLYFSEIASDFVNFCTLLGP